ncbi:hypothetical protein PF002_g16140 [Phytophthora fragariae]|uniref:Uncharacterized protein n=1 Tax=Phytophthora fragariae TaxID=53985 RepID=A0A6A3YKW4_9STRA|nr:hypothetical protein PF003_g34409 [Phytophthora fragariae]KAE9219597.1 hypothetical protein PF002_g16140 [Phytophthora fragariae]
MARPKRKRTPEEIEQAIRDNERINATPAAPEEPAAKKRCQARRRSKCYNLNKEFQALDVAGDVTAAPVEASVFVENTITQPPGVRRDEQPPPEPTVQTTASATAATAVAAPSNSEQPPVLTNAELARRRGAAMSASQQERTRARERERARIRRANMTGSQRERTRRKEAERQRADGPCCQSPGGTYSAIEIVFGKWIQEQSDLSKIDGWFMKSNVFG